MAEKPTPSKAAASPSVSGGFFSAEDIAAAKAGTVNVGARQVAMNSSQYDQGELIGGNNPAADFAEHRGQRQGTLDKLGNGLVRMAGTAATSFVEPFLGASIGTTTAIAAGATGEGAGAAVRSLYDRADTQALDGFNDFLNEKFPMYATKAEEQRGLWAAMPGTTGSANFWFDKVGNGAGFMLGAIAAGAVTGGAADGLKAWKIARNVGKAATLASKVASGTGVATDILAGVASTAAKASSSQSVRTLLVGTMGALGESGMEARQIAKDTGIAVRQQLMQDMGLDPRDYEKYTFTPAQEAHITDLQEAAGNTGFALNMALVGGANALVLPKVFRKGYQAEKIALGNITRAAGGVGYEAAALSGKRKALSIAGKVALNNAEEATQEQLQFAVEKWLPDYYRKQRNLDAEMDVQEYMKSMVHGLEEAYGTKEGWENALLGGIIGLAGAHGAVREVNGTESATQRAVDTLNTAIGKKSASAFYKGLVASNAAAKAKGQAAIDSDAYTYQNNEHTEFASLVRAYSQAGKVEDLLEDIDQAGTLKPDEFKAAMGFDPADLLTESPAQLAVQQRTKVEKLHKLSQEIEAAYPGPDLVEARDVFFGLASEAENATKRYSQLKNELLTKTGISLDALELTDKESSQDKFAAAIEQWLQNPSLLAKDAADVEEKAIDMLRLNRDRVALADAYRQMEDPKHREAVLNAYRTKLENDKAAAAIAAQAVATPASAAPPTTAAAPAPGAPVAPAPTTTVPGASTPAAGPPVAGQGVPSNATRQAAGVTGAATAAPIATGPAASTTQPGNVHGAYMTVEKHAHNKPLRAVIVSDAAGKMWGAIFNDAGELDGWEALDVNNQPLPSGMRMKADRPIFAPLVDAAKAGFAHLYSNQPAAPASSPAAGAASGRTPEQEAVVAKLEGLKANAPTLNADATKYVNKDGEYERATSLKKKFLAGREQLPGDDTFLKENPQFSDRGNVIDLIVRDFFLKDGQLTVADLRAIEDAYATEQAARADRQAKGTADIHEKLEFKDSFFTELLANLKVIKGLSDGAGWVILSDVSTLHGEIGGEAYAGTMDLVAVNKAGEAYIVDLKTQEKSRRSDYGFFDVGQGTIKTNRDGEPYIADESKYREGDLIQQATYAELLRQRTGIVVKGKLIFPMITDGGRNKKVKAVYTSAKLEPVDNNGSPQYSIDLSLQHTVSRGPNVALGKLDIYGLQEHYLGKQPKAATTTFAGALPIGPQSHEDAVVYADKVFALKHNNRIVKQHGKHAMNYWQAELTQWLSPTEAAAYTEALATIRAFAYSGAVGTDYGFNPGLAPDYKAYYNIYTKGRTLNNSNVFQDTPVAAEAMLVEKLNKKAYNAIGPAIAEHQTLIMDLERGIQGMSDDQLAQKIANEGLSDSQARPLFSYAAFIDKSGPAPDMRSVQENEPWVIFVNELNGDSRRQKVLAAAKTFSKSVDNAGDIGDAEWVAFVDTGLVSPERLRKLAVKVQVKLSLDEREYAVVMANVSALEELLLKMSGKVNASLMYPVDYYLQTEFSGAENNPTDNAARAQFQAAIKNPNHPQAKQPLLVRLVKNKNGRPNYNVMTTLVDDQGQAISADEVQVGYIAYTGPRKGMAHTAASQAEMATQDALKAELDAYFLANPQETAVELLHERSSSLAPREEGEVPLSQLDNRFLLGGTTLRVFSQRTDSKSRLLKPRAILGAGISSEEDGQIAALRPVQSGFTYKEGALTDSYVLKVPAPDGLGYRYIGAKTRMVNGTGLQELYDQVASNAPDAFIDSHYFLAAANTGLHLAYTSGGQANQGGAHGHKGSWEVVQKNGTLGQTLGFLRIDGAATVTSQQEFKDALTFYPVDENGKASKAGEPGGRFVASVRYEVPDGATQEELLNLLIPTTGADLYRHVSIEPRGLKAVLPEAVEPLAPEEEYIPQATGATRAAMFGAVQAGAAPAPNVGLTGKDSLKDAMNDVEKDPFAFRVAVEGKLRSEEFRDSVNAFKRIVGDNFEALGLRALPANVYRDGQTMGVFFRSVAYFASASEKGTGYHEAFHAVFRGLLNASDRETLYKAAARRFPMSPNDLAKFKLQSPTYERLSDRDLTRLYLEEQMADAFMDFQNGKPAGVFGRLFRWLQDVVAKLLGKTDELSALFAAMDKGAFTASRTRNTQFTGPAAFKNIPFATVQHSKRMVALLTAQFMKGRQEALDAGKSPEQFLRELIQERFLTDTVLAKPEHENADTRASLGLLDLGKADVGERWRPGVLYRKSYVNPQAVSVLLDQVAKQAKMLEYTPEVDENGDAEDDQENQAADANEAKENFSKGGYLEANALGNVSQEMRMLLSLTTYTNSEGLEDVVDFDQTVSILERILENKRTFKEMYDAIERRVALGENPQLKAVFGRVDKDSRGENGELFQRKFQQGLYRILLQPVQFTFSADGQTKAFGADATNSIEKMRVAKWADMWARTRTGTNHADAKAILIAVDKIMDFEDKRPQDLKGLEQVASDVVGAMAKMGVDLSKTFVFDVLNDKSEEYVWSKPKGSLDLRRSLQDDLGQLSTYDGKGNPFMAELDAQGKRTDATGRALGLAKADANYHDTILNPSYKNAENKSQYAYTQASYLLERARDIQDNKIVADELNALNPLLVGKLAVRPQELVMEYLAGVRAEEDPTGQSYGNMDTKVYLLMGHLAYRGNTGTAKADGFRRVVFGQLEAKSTAMSFKVPRHPVGTFAAKEAASSATVEAITAFTRQQEVYVRRTVEQIAAIQAAIEVAKALPEGRERNLAIRKAEAAAVKNVHFSKWDKSGHPLLPDLEKYRSANESGKGLKDFPRGLQYLVFPQMNSWTAAERADATKLEAYANELGALLLKNHREQLSEAGFNLESKETQALLGYQHGHESFDDYLLEYLFSDFIYRESYSQLSRGNEAWFKDPVDITKRGGGLIAAGPSFGERTYNMVPLQTDAFHIYTENMFPVSIEDQAALNEGTASQELKDATAKVDATDAQGYCTAKRFAFLQRREAKLDRRVLAKLDDFVAGKSDKAGGGWTGISMKNVYYAEEPSNGATYLKMSVFPLFPEVTSFRNKNGKWVAKPGFEKLHNLREQMESLEVEGDETTLAEAYHDSAIKVGLRSLNFRDADGLYRDVLPVSLQNNGLRRQVSNPSGKDKVIDPTQMLQILDSGMDDRDTFLYRSPRGEEYEVKVGDLRKSFQQTLAEIKLDANTKYEKLLSLVVDGESLSKRMLLDNLEASASDENTMAFFGQTPGGDWALSPDMPVIQMKAQQLVLSGFNKNVFSQKVPGTKRSLVSSAMAQVVVDKDDNLVHDWALPYAEQAYLNEDGSLKEGYSTRGLNMHHVATDKDGKEYVKPAEIIVSEELLLKKGITLADLYGPKTSEATRNAILTELNLRIPSQDKHSMMPVKIVGWLPAYMGSVVMAPAQITYLSGADYDIDSLFSLQYAFYLGEDGGVQLYGGEAYEKSAEARWEEYLSYQRAKHPAYNRVVNEKLAADPAYQSAASRVREVRGQLSAWRSTNKEKLGALKEDLALWKKALEAPELTTQDQEQTVDKVKALKKALRKLQEGGVPMAEEAAKLLADLDAKRKLVEIIARRQLKMPETFEQFQKQPLAKQENGYARSNRLMDTRMALALNPKDFEAARTPVELDSMKSDAAIIAPATGAGVDLPLPYNSAPVISQHHIDTGIGMANVGVAAKANNSGLFLTKIKYRLPIAIKFGARWLTGYGNSQENDIVLGKNQDGKPALMGYVKRRKQDTSSSHISAATDNAKERLAGLLNLTSSLLSVVMNGVHLSMGRTRTLVFVNQPILRILAQRKMASASIISGGETRFEVTDNLVKELVAWLSTAPKDWDKDLTKEAKYTLPQLLEQALKEEEFELAAIFQEQINRASAEELAQAHRVDVEGGLDDAAMVSNLSFSMKGYVTRRDSDGKPMLFRKLDAADARKVYQQLEVLLKFKQLEEFTDGWFSKVGKLLGLNKGVGSTFGDLRKFREAGDKITPYQFTNEKDLPPTPGPFTPPYIYLQEHQVQGERSLDANLQALGTMTGYLKEHHLLMTDTVEDMIIRHKKMGLKGDAVEGFQNALLGFFAVNGYQDKKGLRLKDYQYLLTDPKENIAAQWDRTLAKYPDLDQNPFVYNTRSRLAEKKGEEKHPYFRRTFNTHAKLSNAVMESITDGAMALFRDNREEVRELMRLTYLYEGVKNNFQYKTESLVKLFPAAIHAQEAEAMRETLAAVKADKGFEEEFYRFGKHWYSVKKNRATLKQYGKNIMVADDSGNEQPQWALESYILPEFTTPDKLALELPARPDKHTQSQLAFAGVTIDKDGSWNFPEFFGKDVEEWVSTSEKRMAKEVWGLVSRSGHEATYERIPENKMASFQSTFHLSEEELVAAAAEAKALPASFQDAEFGDDAEAEYFAMRAAQESEEQQHNQEPNLEGFGADLGVPSGTKGRLLSALHQAVGLDGAVTPEEQRLLDTWEDWVNPQHRTMPVTTRLQYIRDLNSGRLNTTCTL